MLTKFSIITVNIGLYLNNIKYNVCKGVIIMRIRKQPLGDRNLVGERVGNRRKEINMKQIELLTQLREKGVEFNASGLSKLEGQIRSVNDYELIALSEILGVSVNWLLGLED